MNNTTNGGNVTNIADAREKQTADKLNSVIAAKELRVLETLKRLAQQDRSKGKIPNKKGEREKLGRNVETIAQRLRSQGFGAKDLYGAGSGEEFCKKDDQHIVGSTRLLATTGE